MDPGYEIVGLAALSGTAAVHWRSMSGSVPPRPSGSSRAWSSVKSGGQRVAERVRVMFQGRGMGFRWLAETHAGSVAGDTVVAIALAGTLFFSVPSADARSNVALYLLITLAPFAVIGPFLGRFFERFPAAYRGGMVISAALRVVVALVMAIWIDSIFLSWGMPGANSPDLGATTAPVFVMRLRTWSGGSM